LIVARRRKTSRRLKELLCFVAKKLQAKTNNRKGWS